MSSETTTDPGLGTDPDGVGGGPRAYGSGSGAASVPDAVPPGAHRQGPPPNQPPPGYGPPQGGRAPAGPAQGPGPGQGYGPGGAGAQGARAPQASPSGPGAAGPAGPGPGPAHGAPSAPSAGAAAGASAAVAGAAASITAGLSGLAGRFSSGAGRRTGGRRKEAPTMGTVAYQQSDSAPGQAAPRQQAGGGWGGRPAGPAGGPAGAPRYQQQAPGVAPRGRKARLRVAKVDPWSVMKTTFVLSIAFAVVSVVAAALLWSALNALGVFDSINRTLASVAPANQPNSVTLTSVLSFGKVMSFTALVSVVNIVLFTALATLAAYLYNMCSSLVGGVEVTLADDTAS